MSEQDKDGLVLSINVDDIATAEAAGVQFTRILINGQEANLLSLPGEDDFLTVLGEKAELIWNRAVDVGISVELAQDVARSFEVAALEERTRILNATMGGSKTA